MSDSSTHCNTEFKVNMDLLTVSRKIKGTLHQNPVFTIKHSPHIKTFNDITLKASSKATQSSRWDSEAQR